MVDKTRRETLRIIGAVGTTCAFPFAADELYGQHVHPNAAEAALPKEPQFFSPSEFETISRIADLIIPATETLGALGANVPAYIDFVVNANAMHQETYRKGLKWLEEHCQKQFHVSFAALPAEQQLSLLLPLCEASDTGRKQQDSGVKFFRAVKSMTADGYYTSRIGLMEELGYRGNTVLSHFPQSSVPEH